MEKECKKCNGSGKCPKCEGSGVVENPNIVAHLLLTTDYKDCPSCGGGTNCNKCFGSGSYMCYCSKCENRSGQRDKNRYPRQYR